MSKLRQAFIIERVVSTTPNSDTWAVVRARHATTQAPLKVKGFNWPVDHYDSILPGMVFTADLTETYGKHGPQYDAKDISPDDPLSHVPRDDAAAS